MKYDFRLLGVPELTPELCRDVQKVSREAEGFRQLQLPEEHRRTSEQVDHFVRWNDPEGYMQSLIDPNRDVGGRIRAGNELWGSKVIVAREVGGSAVVGTLFAAQNVSGPLHERLIKRYGPNPSKRFLWISMIAVYPEYQNQGVARSMLSVLLEAANPNQPVAAYPDALNTGVIDWLSRLGFRETDRSPVDRYGTGKKDVEQIRMQADKVSSVLDNLAQRG